MRTRIAAVVGVVVATILSAACSSPPPRAETQSPSVEIAAAREAREVAERDQAASEAAAEPAINQELALGRLNAASDRVEAALSEMDRTCAPPPAADYTGAITSAKCIGRVLSQVCPGIGEGALTDMSRAARDMGAPEASWSLEQAAQDCWNAVFHANMPSGGTNPRQVGASVTRMGEKLGEASAMLR